MTIQELQAYVDTKPDQRELINVIVDYLQSNAGDGDGGGSQNLDEVLSEGGVLTTDRTANLDGNKLNIQNGDLVFGDVTQTEDQNIKITDRITNNIGIALNILGSDSQNNDGGNINILAGNAVCPDNGGRGGNITIRGGIGREATQKGGIISIIGGEGQADPGSGTSDGGDVIIRGGFSDEPGSVGGSVKILAGQGETQGAIEYTADTHTFDGQIILSGEPTGAGYVLTDLAGDGNLSLEPSGVFTAPDITWSVINILNTPPVSPSTGDTFLAAVGSTGAWSGHDNEIPDWNGATWDFSTATAGDLLQNDENQLVYKFGGPLWVAIGRISLLAGGNAGITNLRAGTSDNKAFSIITNNIKRISLAANGDLTFNKLTGAVPGVMALSTTGQGSNIPLSSVLGYKSYVALIAQSNEDDPVADSIFQNGIGNIVWTRISEGIYNGTLAGAFPVNKVFITPSQVRYAAFNVGGGGYIYCARLSDNAIQIQTYDDGYLPQEFETANFPIEIRVYN